MLTKTGFQYDAHGNLLQSKTEDSTGSTSKYIQITATYTSAGTYMSTQTDARGKTATTVTDPDKGTVTSVTDPKGQVVNSQYDSLRRLTKTSTMLTSTQEVKSENTYDGTKGFLTASTHNTTTAASGDVTYSFGYDSWGVPVTRTGPMRIPGTVGFIQPFRYRGYLWDEETGLYYLRSRYYRPSWGRFISADALILTNLYSYCNNDPVLMNDADGKEGLPFCVDEIIDLDEIDEQRKRRINENWDAVCAHSQQNRRRSNHVAVSRFMWRFGQFEKNKRNFRRDGDSGCAMCVRAGVLGRIGPHSSKVYYAGASSMFNNDMVISGDIEDVGGPDGLIVGMVVGTPMDGAFDDGLYHVEHVGVYAGYYDFGKGPVPAVYSFNTDTNRVNLRPFTDNNWKYYGWHEGVVLDP